MMEPQQTATNHRRSWLLRCLLAATLIVIMLLGYWVHHWQHERLRREIEQALATIAALKVNQIVSWRNERLTHGRAIAEYAHLASHRSLASFADPPALQDLYRHLEGYVRHYQFDDALVVNPDGTIVFSILDESKTLCPATRQALADALEHDQVVMSALHSQAGSETPHLAVVVPVSSYRGKALAAIVLVCNPQRLLYPLIKSWPSPSKTGETLLVRRDDEDVLFLNDLLHVDGAALRLRVPIARHDLPASMAILGTVGPVVGRDYRGVEVIAHCAPIPNSPWFMIAKEDMAEAFALWRFRSTMIICLLVGVVFIAAISTVTLWQIDRRAQYQSLYEAEYALRDSERRLETLLANLPGMVYRCQDTPDWPMDFVSDGALSVTGYTAEELLAGGGTRFGELIHGDDRNVITQAVETAIDDDSSFQLTYRITDKSGELRWVWERGMAVDIGEDGTAVLEGFITDITEQRRAKEKQQSLHQQLVQSQKLEAIGRLAGGVAHDFNNILSVILGNSEMALEDLPPDSQLHTDLSEIHEAAERSAALTKQLLAFARKQTVEPRRLDVNETIEGMLVMVRRLLGENISLSWSPGHGIAPVWLDPTQLDQLLVNLCINARDAIDGVGTISISTENVSSETDQTIKETADTAQQYVVLRIADTGHGMDSETQSRIFEPFFSTKEVGKGTGLGLATVYGIVKQNNGLVEVDSSPGAGTTFSIFLPCCDDHTETQADSNLIEIPHGTGQVILLVEDDIKVLNLTRRMLEGLDYRVITANTPAEAIDLADSTEAIDLLLTDLVMPEMNGRELRDRIQERHRDLPTLFMSGYTANVIGNRGIIDQEVNFIAKPFTKSALAKKLFTLFADTV